jgi:hypothetical protein
MYVLNDYSKNDFKINKTEVDYFISFGLNCCNGMAIKQLGLKKYSLPFDSIVSSPKIIYDCLTNNFKDFCYFDDKKIFLECDFNVSNLFESSTNDLRNHTNKYGIYFNHYLDKNVEVIKDTFTRRINRFLNILKTSKKIIFIYSTELFIYDSKFRNDQDVYHDYLIKIENFLLKNYKDLNFKIICFNLNKEYLNSNNIYNINVSVDESYLSDNIETHDLVFDKYRLLIKNEINSFII